MDNENKFQLLRRGIQSVRNDVAVENLSTLSNILGLPALPLLKGSRYCSAEGHHPPPLDEE